MSTQGMVESEPGSASFIIGSHPAKSKHLNQSSSGERAAYTSRNVEFRTSRAQSAISHSSERTLKGRSSHTPLLRVEQRAKSGRSKSAQSAQSRQSKGRPLSGKESVAATLVCPTPHSTASRPGTAVSTGEAKRRFSSAAPSRTGALSQSSIGHRQELSRVRVISQPIGLEPDVIAARDEVFEKGVFELVQKKIVPAAADFTKHLSRINALRAQSAPLHSFLERYPKYEFDTSPFPTAIRFDRIGAMHKIDNYANFGTLVPGDTPIPATPFPSKQSISSQQRSSRSPGAEEVDCEGGLVSSTVFAISNGSLVLSSPTFLWWRKISTLDDATKMAAVRRIELFCRRFRVPWVEVDYQKLEAFLSEPLISRFDVPAILALLANGLEIEQRIMKPGYLFFGVEAKRLAASRIAETWLATRQRKKHVYMVRKLRAAEVFRFYYRRKLQRRRLDKSAKKRFETILATYRSLQADFFATWTTKFHGLPRTIIHLPSLTVDAEARATAGFTVFEQMQLGRVMDLSDSDVNVVFISHPLDAALQGYTNEFLESHFAKPVEETLASCRLDFVVPENCNRFKPHSSLCAMLLASPIALQRIRDIAKDTSAFILPAVVSKREVELAVELNIPILGLDFAVEGIEGVLSTNPLSHSASLSEDIYTSVSVCIFPDGSFRLLGTSDTVIVGDLLNALTISSSS
ncbi:hypothetical protein DFJ73DRAFT_302725 [Zopfochytrium polystomum]|nr:hypothetical protein DFJ73DRAFT_302725 [Zopfochytrium polystomum]